MNNISFSPRGWDDYIYWQTQDKKTLKRLNALLEDIIRNKFAGLGKPEPLKHSDGCWSRRIDDANRIVYQVSADNDIIVLACRGHYED